MNQTLITSLVFSLALTLALEAGFFFLTGKRDRKDLLLLLLVNVLTNPVVVLSFWLAALYTDWNTYIILAPLELFAVLIEGYYYKKYGLSFRRPYLFSLFANIISFGIGEMVQHLLSLL
ncbi:MAG: hypothetical protein FWH55_10630 [Oscillospiraceae bacterium]|nr:hypothetical protein [Oscillospiraceae bacterium]